MLDHIFLTVSDTDRSIAFYAKVVPILGSPTPSTMTARMARRVMQTSRALAPVGECSSG